MLIKFDQKLPTGGVVRKRMNTQVLIVESDENLGSTWRYFLERHGFDVTLAQTQKQALDNLRFNTCNVLIINLMMPDASALAITDFASYKNPDISIIVVSASNFFSDGSIFDILPNARGFMNYPIEPDDLVAVVDHCSGS